ncbi:hypothetical protein ADICYQ_5277 [Cyclobacterium qasimii M12-11B]|uniref:Uncharacterized protein n=1 Tax=Cyclobacterium qasimii M12-11B TaxID=641524 RepID=S7V862_9BACT|nr:hypothetical protein ADICYQ_5277 [Cyclobacterium qasimii M12-11B]
MVALLILDKNIRYFLGKGLKVITLQIIQFEVVGIKKMKRIYPFFWI